MENEQKKQIEEKMIDSSSFIEAIPDTVAKEVIIDINKECKTLCERLDIEYDPTYISMFLFYDNSMRKEVVEIKDELGTEKAIELFQTYIDSLELVYSMVGNINDSLTQLLSNYRQTIDTLITGNNIMNENEDDGLSIPFKKESK